MRGKVVVVRRRLLIFFAPFSLFRDLVFRAINLHTRVYTIRVVRSRLISSRTLCSSRVRNATRPFFGERCSCSTVKRSCIGISNPFLDPCERDKRNDRKKIKNCSRESRLARWWSESVRFIVFGSAREKNARGLVYARKRHLFV